MDSDEQRHDNQATFRRLKATLGRDYPPGRFVALAEGRVVADADRLDALYSALREMGKDPRQVLVVQAGVDYPETAVILLEEEQP